MFLKKLFVYDNESLFNILDEIKKYLNFNPIKVDANDLDNKIAAIKSLGEIKYKSAVPLINNIVSDEKNQRLRLAAVIALGEIKDYSSVDVLVDVLDDEDWEAVRTLKNLK